MIGKRGAIAIFVAASSAALAYPAVVFACTPSANISDSPTSGHAGSQTTVTGRAFDAGVPVQLHWGSTSGPLLATAIPGSSAGFTAVVTVPAGAAPSTQVIAAVTVTPQGTFKALTTFQVTPTAPVATRSNGQPSGGSTSTQPVAAAPAPKPVVGSVSAGAPNAPQSRPLTSAGTAPSQQQGAPLAAQAPPPAAAAPNAAPMAPSGGSIWSDPLRGFTASGAPSVALLPATAGDSNGSNSSTLVAVGAIAGGAAVLLALGFATATAYRRRETVAVRPESPGPDEG